MSDNMNMDMSTCVFSPSIEAAVDDGVVHCGAHGQPQHKQIDLLNGFPAVQSFIEASRDEIHMVRQPTDGKCHHHHNHHLHHLKAERSRLDRNHQRYGPIGHDSMQTAETKR